MRCPFCKYDDTKVIDTRSADENTVVRRRRACERCGERFTTYERQDTMPFVVIKRDKTREMFDRAKLLDGIMKSCNKRPVSVERVESIVSDIEMALSNSMKKEIDSGEIGDMAMRALKEADEVAYVRFASVYKHFKDIDSFMEELTDLMRDRPRGG
ncbi:MAG: transcriptional regulator NrdR [Clostridiales bacterium]|nr:transcriptional regulator NrdR [Clostridiales bacterium]